MRSERRFLSVLMCDLSDSTELSDRLDPDVFAKIIDTVINISADEIERFDGFISAYQGDSVIALFGYPTALEHHAAQAIRAGLSITTKIQQYNDTLDTSVAIRIGIASGTTLVSPVIRRGTISQTTAYGYVPNLSGRLQSTAKLNTVYIDDRTQRLTDRFFTFEDLGYSTFKGFEKPKRIWEVKSQCTHIDQISPTSKNIKLIGRTNELKKVKDFIDIPNSSNKTLIIYGEPGIGKSKLMQESIEYCKKNASINFFNCNILFSNSPFHPCLPSFLKSLGIDEQTESTARKKILKNAISKYDNIDDEIVPFILSVLGIDPGSTVNINEHIQQQFESFLYQLIFDAGNDHPKILLIDDIQWMDTASAAFIKLVQNSLPSLKIIATSRISPNDSLLPATDTIHLHTLADDTSHQLINTLSNSSFSKEIVNDILLKADGIPLYIEEIVSAQLSKSESVINRFSDQQHIPDTLQYSLLTRLDSLGETKRVASIAALIGGHLDQKVLKIVSGFTDEVIDNAVEQLIDNNILTKIEFDELPRIQFRHGLIQEAAGSLIPSLEQKQYHYKIANTLLEQSNQRINFNSSVIAYHFSASEHHEEALKYWKIAGDNTANTRAKKEAADQYNNAIISLQKLATSNTKLELELQRSLGDVLYSAVGHATSAGLKAFGRAIELARLHDDKDTEAQVLDGLFGIHFNSADFNAAETACMSLLELADSTYKNSQTAIATQGIGMCNFHKGDFDTAKKVLEMGLSLLCDPESVNSDFPSMTYLYLAATNQILGLYEEASKNYELACESATAGTSYNLAAALGNGCHFYQFQGNNKKIKSNLAKLIPLCEEHGFGMWLSLGKFFSAWIKAEEDSPEVGLEAMIHTFNDLEDDIEKTYYLGLIAKIELKAGLYNSANKTVIKALKMADKNNEHYYTCELLRTQAIIASKLDNQDKSVILFGKAKELAYDQNAQHWLKLINANLVGIQTNIH